MYRMIPVFMALAILVETTFCSLAVAVEQPVYKDYFSDEALRVDLIHTGTRGKEYFGIDELVAEPIWPGTRVHLIDTTDFGKYRFRVIDKATKREIFSQGYCTLFGEWTTTKEAADGLWKSMSEPLRMPFPKAPVVLIIELREDSTGQFKELQRFDIDTRSYDIRRDLRHLFEVDKLHISGRDPSVNLDIVIVPDGYAAADAEKLSADGARFAKVLINHAPFNRHKDKISIRLVKAFSRESGVDEPRKGVYRDTIIGTTFDTFHSPRYLTTTDMKSVREVAANAPYDAIFVMVNSRRYGGGGIFNMYSVFTSDSEYSEYVMVHEFGHGFGALADEYYSSDTGYDEEAFYTKGAEPWEPNITAARTRKDIKWGHLIDADTPIPTPNDPKYADKVGLFEGAGYKARGLYRATFDSKMFHKGLLPFGLVNEAAIEEMIRYFTDGEVK